MESTVPGSPDRHCVLHGRRALCGSCVLNVLLHQTTEGWKEGTCNCRCGVREECIGGTRIQSRDESTADDAHEGFGPWSRREWISKVLRGHSLRYCAESVEGIVLLTFMIGGPGWLMVPPVLNCPLRNSTFSTGIFSAGCLCIKKGSSQAEPFPALGCPHSFC